MRQLQHQLNFTGSGQRDAPASSASGAGTTEASGTGLAGLGRISPARARVLTGDKRYNMGLRWTNRPRQVVVSGAGKT
jgi:hypothetical protein